MLVRFSGIYTVYRTSHLSVCAPRCAISRRLTVLQYEPLVTFDNFEDIAWPVRLLLGCSIYILIGGPRLFEGISTRLKFV